MCNLTVSITVAKHDNVYILSKTNWVCPKGQKKPAIKIYNTTLKLKKITLDSTVNQDKIFRKAMTFT